MPSGGLQAAGQEGQVWDGNVGRQAGKQAGKQAGGRLEVPSTQPWLQCGLAAAAGLKSHAPGFPGLYPVPLT